MLVLFILVLSHEVALGSRVVGFRQPLETATVAVRGVVAPGTAVSGIRFYSNDATIFPRVFLAADSGDEDVPHAGAVLRSVANVPGESGYVEVKFPVHEVSEQQYLWAVVQFPDREFFRGPGAGGGPGIGLREAPGGMIWERSLYSGSGGFGELRSPVQFNISLIAQATASKTGTSGEVFQQRVSVRMGPTVGTGTSFSISLLRRARVTLRIFDIGGREVDRLLDADLPAGVHETRWSGLDARGRPVASGIYLYKLELEGQQRSGKIVVVR